MSVSVSVSLLLFTFLFLPLSSPLQLHTLTLKPLPTPTPLPQPEPESLSSLTDPNSIQLILHHSDSLNSANSTSESLFNLRLERDSVRAESLANTVKKSNGNGFSGSVVSGLAQGSGEYFTRLGIGTPARYVYMVLDTGSDIVWLQCAPCRKCYEQADPVFDPSKSASFRKVRCRTPLCQKLDSPGCNSRQTCLYQVSYGDGSFTVGDFSTETLTFRRTRVNNIALGCGHDNEGLFVGAAGLLGLGRGKLSFPTQVGDRFGKKFSYCLVDRSASSKPSSIVFGEAAISKKAVFTPLLSNPKLDTFYYIGLTGFSVGGSRVRGIAPSLFSLDMAGGGGVIIDSGTSVTRLTRPAYVALRDAFLAGAKDLKRAPDFSLFDTCFDLSGKTSVKVPTVVMHFGAAQVTLPASNYLIPVDSKGTFCFAFAGTTSGLSIIGNIQQQGFRVVYDLEGSRVGFAPRGCA